MPDRNSAFASQKQGRAGGKKPVAVRKKLAAGGKMNERRAKMKFFTVFASLFSIHISFPSVCILRFESLDSTKQAFQNRLKKTVLIEK